MEESFVGRMMKKISENIIVDLEILSIESLIFYLLTDYFKLFFFSSWVRLNIILPNLKKEELKLTKNITFF